MKISRRHCRISSTLATTDVVYVEDLQSENGTFINGVKLDPTGGVTRLHNGDKITLGERWGVTNQWGTFVFYGYDEHADRIQIIKFLILRGAAVRPAGSPAAWTQLCMSNPTSSVHQPALLELLGWAEGELSTHRQYTELVLGCGVHASRDLAPAQVGG